MKPKPLSALFLYFLLTLLFLYPIPFEPGRLVSIAPDTFQNLWNFWWVKKSLLQLHTSPYFTDYLFYPTGTSLAFQTFSPYNSLLAIPLQGIGNRIVAYNFLFFSSFILAALGGYLLTFHFVRNRFAAFLAGFVFAFSPYHFSRAMHVNMFSIQWIPFYCLFLFRLREKPSWTNAAGAGIFLALSAMCDWHYLIYLFLVTLIYLLYYSATVPRDILSPRFWLSLCFSSILFLILISPFAYPLFSEMRGGGESYLYMSVGGEPDLLGFQAVKGYFFFWPVLLGYATLLLSLYAVLLIRERDVRFWGLVAAFAFVMTLGTHLSVLGKDFPGTPLPFALLQKLPMLRAIHIPYRFLVIIMLSLSILSGFAVHTITEKTRTNKSGRGNRGVVLSCLILFIIGFEYLAIPRPTYTADIPPFFERMAREEGDFAVVSLPFRDRGWDLYYQTLHEKKISWAYVSRRDPAALEFLSGTPPFHLFLAPDRIQTETISASEMRSCAETLGKLDVRYVLINKPKRYGDPRRLGRPGSALNMLRVGLTPYSLNETLRKTMVEIEKSRSNIRTTDEEMARFRGLLDPMLGGPFYEDDEVVVYRVDSK